MPCFEHHQVELLKKSIQQVEDQLSQYRAKASDLEGQLSVLGIEMERVTTQAEEDKQELRSQLSTLTSKLSVTEQDKLSLTSELAQLSQQMQAVKSSMNEQVMAIPHMSPVPNLYYILADQGQAITN